MKICLIGHGHLGKWHAEKLEMIYGNDFIAIVENDKSKHQEISKKYPSKKVCADLEDIDDHFDAVAIATPTVFHYELIKKALSKNKHCFVEKPMTANLEESNLVKNLLENKNLVFQVGIVSDSIHSGRN